MSTTALVIDINVAVALIATVIGYIVYEVSPPATTDTKEKVQHLALAIFAFILLWIAASQSGGLNLDAVTVFAFFSAGQAPNLVLDMYQKHTAPAPAPTPPPTQ